MQVQLETVGQLERRLNFAIPVNEIDAAVNAKLKKVARTARIQGFRPGKAPLKIVEQSYGPQARDEAVNEAVQAAYANAVSEQKLRVAGYPRFEGLPMDGEAFKFSAVFEVYPEIQIGDLTDKEVERPTLTVSDNEIDRTIEILRKQRTKFERVERAAEKGDRVIVDFKGTLDGVAFEGGSASNYAFEAGAGKMLPEFDSAVVGMKEDETKVFDLTFPDDYQGKDVAGKTAQFEVTMKNVAAPVLPEVDGEFAKLLGIEDGDVQKMREEIKRNVEREVKRRLTARAKDAVMQLLIDIAPSELPKALVELETSRLIENARQEMQQRGFDPSNMPFPPQLFEDQAKRRVHLGLVLSEVVRANGLTATPEQIRAEIEEVADSYEDPEEVVRWYYASRDRLEAPENMALEENVVEFVYRSAKPVDKELSFDELMGNNT